MKQKIHWQWLAMINSTQTDFVILEHFFFIFWMWFSLFSVIWYFVKIEKLLNSISPLQKCMLSIGFTIIITYYLFNLFFVIFNVLKSTKKLPFRFEKIKLTQDNFFAKCRTIFWNFLNLWLSFNPLDDVWKDFELNL